MKYLVASLFYGLAAMGSAVSMPDRLAAEEGIVADEVHIQQESGTYRKNKPVVPLGNMATGKQPEGSVSAAPAGATNPNTCDAKNATSQSCYTATQQGHK